MLVEIAYWELVISPLGICIEIEVVKVSIIANQFVCPPMTIHVKELQESLFEVNPAN